MIFYTTFQGIALGGFFLFTLAIAKNKEKQYRKPHCYDHRTNKNAWDKISHYYGSNVFGIKY